ncbi:beta-N-acetylhexosaminidase [Maribellus sp. CM-23]|uniref:beta-N-acetylhexosaminidase n=1 Tax=Maribellus sp. CM-23 TaxID=2781026 RepID=UPI001F3F391C|nr:beta-N-acetylhexosaminidase [Maribellus sp. CM-23]MCE4565057.1 beta-N-acetylhexosaminidase [Maribellus sp. CM-23]
MNNSFPRKIIIIGLFCFLKTMLCGQVSDKPLIFPFPQEIVSTNDTFHVDENIVLLYPENASDNDIRLSRQLAGELSDRYGLAVEVAVASSIPANKKVILIGSRSNKLIKTYCRKNNLSLNESRPGNEGYFMHVRNDIVAVGGWDDAGAFYGLQSLRQLFMETNGKFLPGLTIMDWPVCSFRGVRIYVPGSENIPFFKRFVSDFMALYKFNKVILEITCMRLDKHPEVNAGWVEFANYLKDKRLNSTEGPRGELKTSSHYDAGDGLILEKDEVRDIVDFARKNFLEVIPEIPSLSHGYYLLTRHPELAEYPGDRWPDTYCPSNPGSYELMFEVYNEYIEVMQPRMVHIGHDEWYGAPVGVCPRCSGKDYSKLFAEDVRKIHDYFSEKKIRIAMWGDYLLEEIRGAGEQEKTSSTGIRYKVPGAVGLETLKEQIPKDILIFNWFWGRPELEQKLSRLGFEQVFGNFKPNISNWTERIEHPAILGGAPSSWAATTEANFGKDLLLDFIGCANLLWSQHTISVNELGNIIRSTLAAQARRNLKGKSLLYNSGKPVAPLNIVPFYNMHADDSLFNFNPGKLNYGEVPRENKSFDIGSGLVAVETGKDKPGIFPSEITKITVNKDVTAIIFLHACLLPGMNEKSYFNIPDFPATSDLLGWYEIIYEDGLTEILPIRYGVNILEWNPGGEKSIDRGEGTTGAPQNAYCYEADPVICSTGNRENPVTLYACEWQNKRLGKKIREINLKGTNGFYRTAGYLKAEGGPLAPPNGIILGAVSLIK